ncbi:MAG TPA: DHA2 family efflux MFS transporter permease subunit [Solirubrobacteraceae bacterium]|nr:DHA2 family efflux MFS transporter permease subunit [Solirubrobacteraceae bacterium]
MPGRRKRLALIAAILGSFVAGLDATAVNVALPAIRADLGGGLAGQQWVSNAYLLALGSLILVGGSLGDLYGERRVFSIGVGGFGVVSLLCAIAPSIGFLIACRALQGAFGALLTPSSLAVIVSAFPRDERGGAIGSWTAWSAIATVIGPLAGGYLVDAVSWRLIFAVNVPFVIATLVIVSIAVPPRPPGTSHARVDWLGAALTFFGLAGPVLALIRQPVVGWSSPQVWGPGIGGLILLGIFVDHERRTPAPMLPLGLFKRRNFAVGNLQTFTMYGGLGITFFLLVLFLQEVAGYSALESGFALLPVTIVTFLLSKRMGRLADRYGPRLFMGLGPLTAAVGLAWMTQLSAHVDYVTDLLPPLLLFSLGLASTVAPLTAAVLSDADEGNAGIASGVNNAVARVASLIAIAAIGAVVSSQFNSTLDQNLAAVRLSAAARTAVSQARKSTLARVDPAVTGVQVAHAVQSASVDAFQVAIGISAALVALGGVLGLVGIRNPRRVVRCEDCAGGQLAGQPLDAAGDPAPAAASAPATAATAGSVT